MSTFNQLVPIFLFFCLLWLLRGTRVMYPVMLIITLLHEFSHALAATISGGEAKMIRVFPDGRGVTLTRGGNRFLLYNAGYLGSTFLGALIFCLPYSSLGNYSLLVLVLMLLLIIGLWVRDVFTFVFTCGLVSLMSLASLFVSSQAEKLVVIFLGMSCVMYSFLETNRFAKTVGYQPAVSDAKQLAQLTLIPAWIWVLVWRVLSVVILFLLFRFVWIVKT